MFIASIVPTYTSYHLCCSLVNALLKLAILHIASYVICSDTIPINNNGISFVINTNAVSISNATECVVDDTANSYTYRSVRVLLISVLEYYASAAILCWILIFTDRKLSTNTQGNMNNNVVGETTGSKDNYGRAASTERNTGFYHRIVSALSFPEMFKVVGLLIYPYVNAYILHQLEEHNHSSYTNMDPFKYSDNGYPSNITLLLLFSNSLGISVWLIYARAIQTALNSNSIHVALIYIYVALSVVVRIAVRYIGSGLSLYEIWLLGVL